RRTGTASPQHSPARRNERANERRQRQLPQASEHQSRKTTKETTMTHRALFLLLLPVAGFAADPLACVDPAFINAFLESGQGESTRFSTELPAEAARLHLPAEFELVGSKSSESYVTVAYRSGENVATALSSSVESLKRAGWKDPPADG